MTPAELTSAIAFWLRKAQSHPGELGQFYQDFVDATMRWIKPLFLTEESGEDPLDKFIAVSSGGSPEAEEKVAGLLAQNQAAAAEFAQLVTKLNGAARSRKEVNITGDKNVSNLDSNNNSITIS